ncbi:MAG: PAS domain S-box protein [Rhodoferax sp.]|uniref:PAS domain S-box protein n=1 Tax=Rhodoferax sp. TaxID=50421 RepID=UPI003016AFC4
MAYQLTVSYQTARESATEHVQNLALVLESKLYSDLDAAQRNVSDMATAIEPAAMVAENVSRYETKITPWLKSQVLDIASASVLQIFGANGDLLYSNLGKEAPLNIADSSHFLQLKANPASSAIFSEVLQSRVPHSPALVVARPVRNPAGEFLGVAVAAIDLNAIHEQFRNIQLGRDGSVLLRRLDTGALVVRYPDVVDVSNQPSPDAPVRLAIYKEGPNGVLETTSPVDGVHRLFGFRTLGELPFFLAVGIADKSYLAGWRADALILGVGALIFLIILAISEYLRSSSELKVIESEERFRHLINHNHAIILQIDPASGRIQDANESACLFYGWTHAEMCAMLIQDINQMNSVQVAAEYAAAVQGKRNYFVFPHRLANGDVRTVEVHSSPITVGDKPLLVSIVHDITEREQAVEKLRVSYLALKAVSQGVLISGVDGLILSVNDAFMAITGFDKSEILGHTCRFVQGPLTDPKNVAAIRVARESLTDFAGEVLNYRKDGSVFWNELTISPVLDTQGKLTHFIGITRDITERKTAALALQQSEEFKLAILDSVPAEIAVVDYKGVILAVNEHWRRFALENGIKPGTPAANTEVGTNYLSVCQEGQDDSSEGAAAARDGIQAVLDGKLPSFRQEYPCHSPEEERWFTMNVTPLGRDAHGGAVITHTNHTQRRQMEEQVRQLAFHDGLTKLPNRLLFNDRLIQSMAASKRAGFYCALIFLDLDNFKPLNDLHGHDAGDLLLIEVAKRLKSCVRAMDTVARFGGDEFVVLLSVLHAEKDESTEQAAIIAEIIRRTLAVTYLLTIQHEGKAPTQVEHHCTASIGVTLFVDHETSPDDILKEADSAMYAAKTAGRNRVKFHETSD